MASNYTEAVSSSIVQEGAAASLNLVFAEDTEEVVETTQTIPPSGALYELTICPAPKFPIAAIRKQEPIPFKSVPPCVHGFVKTVAKVAGVRCVVVEEGENNTIHITTFAEPLTEECREAVYAIEADLVQGNPNLMFDFHLRDADGSRNIAAAISGKHYFAIWGGVDADPQ